MHKPVLLDEALGFLDPGRGGTFVDGTLGGGGHAKAVLEAGGEKTRLIGFDRDRQAVERCREILKPYGGRVELRHERFEDLGEALGDLMVDGILLDLGVSSFMLDDPQRGFSFMQDGPLDMRMDRDSGPTAADIVNTWDRRDLARIFKKYGEEPFAGKIAAAIERQREKEPFTATLQLAEIVRRAVPYKKSRTHPATRVFQALRIAVNTELDRLEAALMDAVDHLNPGGRIVVISFHSLEDRIVKHSFSSLAKGCVCPPDLPQCVCGRSPILKRLTRKPVRPTPEEAEENPRSRSALLRAAERIAA